MKLTAQMNSNALFEQQTVRAIGAGLLEDPEHRCAAKIDELVVGVAGMPRSTWRWAG